MESFELLNINYVMLKDNVNTNLNTGNNVLQRISQRRLMALFILWMCVLSSSMSNEISYNNMVFGANYEKFYASRLNHRVCLIMAESSGNTRAINRANTDGSIDYGLFQINNRYWCEEGKKGKECNIKCSGAVIVLKKSSCIVHNHTFVHGETFLLDCRTQCVCQNGKYGCSSLCPQESLPPQCDHPQLLKMPGHCCRQWLCNSQHNQEYNYHHQQQLGQQQHHHNHYYQLPTFKQYQQSKQITTDEDDTIVVVNGSSTLTTSKDNNIDNNSNTSSNANSTYYILSTNNFNKTNNNVTTATTSYNDRTLDTRILMASSLAADAGEKSQQDMKYSQWSSCTMSCGTGLSQRQLNTEYETITETRVCQNRMCSTTTTTTSSTTAAAAKQTDDNTTANDSGRRNNVTHQSFEKHLTFYHHQHHHRRKGHDCRATQHTETPVYYTIGTCQSLRAYRPKYCGQCHQPQQESYNNNDSQQQQLLCCKPLLTSTINVKFICDNTRDDATFETDMDLVYDNLQLGINLWTQNKDNRTETRITTQQKLQNHNINNNNSNLTRVIHVNVQWILKCICLKCNADDTDEFYMNSRNSSRVNRYEFVTRAPKTEVILHRVHRTAPP